MLLLLEMRDVGSFVSLRRTERQKSDVRSQKSEVGKGQRSEVRCQMSEVRKGQRSGRDRDQMSDVRCQMSEVRGKMKERGNVKRVYERFVTRTLVYVMFYSNNSL